MDPIATLTEYLKHASVSTDPAFKDGVLAAHAFVVEQLTKLNFEVESIQTPLHPIVLAKRRTDPSHPHVMIYAHYDVQPADPVNLWDSAPFSPVIKDNCIYARGSTDNKGPFITQLYALHNTLQANPDLPLNITFLVEGEEEIGSPSFAEFLKTHQDVFREADVLLISDTTSPSVEQITFTTALRGIIALEVHVEGPKMDLHSGLFGGPILNPIRALSKLLSTLHDDDGRVNIPNFYDDIEEPAAWERDQLKLYPTTENELKELTGIPEFCPPKGYSALESTRFAPTVEFNGITGGYQGKGGKTIIPAKASAKLTCRLVSNQDPEKIISLIRNALEKRAPRGVKVRVIQKEDSGHPYLSIPPNRSNSPNPYPEVLKKAYESAHEGITKATSKEPLYLREGGSIPIIGLIKAVTDLDSIMIGLSLNSDNMHSPNESFNLKMLEQGSKIYQHILTSIASK